MVLISLSDHGCFAISLRYKFSPDIFLLSFCHTQLKYFFPSMYRPPRTAEDMPDYNALEVPQPGPNEDLSKQVCECGVCVLVLV